MTNAEKEQFTTDAIANDLNGTEVKIDNNA